MKASEIRELGVEEMRQKLTGLKEAYFNLRFQHGTGQLENPKAMTQTRRDIARVMTLIEEKQKQSKNKTDKE